MRRLRRSYFPTLIMVQLIAPLLGPAPDTFMHPGAADAWTGETDWNVPDPGTVMDRFDRAGGDTDSGGTACILTPLARACRQWLEDSVGGMWIEGSLCVGRADLGDLLCGLDMAGFVEKADYSLFPGNRTSVLL